MILWGLVLLIGLPIVAVLAMVTLVGLPLGLGLLLALGLIYGIGYTAGAWILGRRVVSAGLTDRRLPGGLGHPPGGRAGPRSSAGWCRWPRSSSGSVRSRWRAAAPGWRDVVTDEPGEPVRTAAGPSAASADAHLALDGHRLLA